MTRRTMFDTSIHTGAIVLALSCAVVACSSPESRGPEARLGAPGIMEVVSTMTLYDPNALPLIANGSFEDWPENSPDPAGPFVNPRAVRASWVLRRHVLDESPEGQIAARQRWSQSDSAARAPRLFGVRVHDLRPESNYRFSFRANTLGSVGAAVLVYGVYGGNKFAPIAVPLVELEGINEWKDYTAWFDSGVFSEVKIATRSPAAGSVKFPLAMLWDDWQLYLAE